MTFHVSLGWWLLPLSVTVFLIFGWRLFGVRMQPQRGSMFPDLGGALIEGGGYLVAVLLFVIVWLLWGLAS